MGQQVSYGTNSAVSFALSLSPSTFYFPLAHLLTFSDISAVLFPSDCTDVKSIHFNIAFIRKRNMVSFMYEIYPFIYTLI